MLDCNKQNITTMDLIESMLRVASPLTGLAIVVVSGHNESALQCSKDTKHFTFEDFLRASIGVDNCGKQALRIKFIDSCDSKKTCKVRTGYNPLRDMFAYDSTTKTYALVLNQSS